MCARRSCALIPKRFHLSLELGEYDDEGILRRDRKLEKKKFTHLRDSDTCSRARSADDTSLRFHMVTDRRGCSRSHNFVPYIRSSTCICEIRKITY